MPRGQKDKEPKTKGAKKCNKCQEVSRYTTPAGGWLALFGALLSNANYLWVGLGTGVTVPLAWYPCLSSSKHHAAYTEKGELDLLKVGWAGRRA